jgi:hypothetical protein
MTVNPGCRAFTTLATKYLALSLAGKKGYFKGKVSFTFLMKFYQYNHLTARQDTFIPTLLAKKLPRVRALVTFLTFLIYRTVSDYFPRVPLSQRPALMRRT